MGKSFNLFRKNKSKVPYNVAIEVNPEWDVDFSKRNPITGNYCLRTDDCKTCEHRLKCMTGYRKEPDLTGCSGWSGYTGLQGATGSTGSSGCSGVPLPYRHTGRGPGR